MKKKLFLFTIDCEWIAVKDGKTLRPNVLALNSCTMKWQSVNFGDIFKCEMVVLVLPSCYNVCEYEFVGRCGLEERLAKLSPGGHFQPWRGLHYWQACISVRTIILIDIFNEYWNNIYSFLVHCKKSKS